MCDNHDRGRRDALKLLGALGIAGLAGSARAAGEGSIGALIPGKGWVPADSDACPGDGTPLQFMPRTAPDADPLTDELGKYPKCPYCGMDRTQWNHSRHLVQYDDDLVDGTCSIHCLALSLALNLDRGPKAIYAADFGSAAEIKPLVPVDEATYLIESSLKGTMSRTSKMAFADAQAAQGAMSEHGGRTGSFDDALGEAYLGMAKDTMGIRKRRAERRRKMTEKKG
jgi:nitrous oxide reductase accessory protein NosL